MTTILFKVIVIGAVGVGKTTLISRLRRRGEPHGEEGLKPRAGTIGCGFVRITIDTDPECMGDVCDPPDKIVLDIWDTAGEERYHALSPLYYRNVDIVLCVFDLGTPPEIDQLVSSIRTIPTPDRAEFIFVGNKLDLHLHAMPESQTILDRVQSKLPELKPGVLFTSALRSWGITTLRKAIIDAAYKIYLHRAVNAELSTIFDSIYIGETAPVESRCCGVRCIRPS